MKVKIYDVNQPDRVLTKDYPVDPVFGVPAVGDELRLRERAYQDNHFVKGTVVRRIWRAVVGEPHETEVRLFLSLT